MIEYQPGKRDWSQDELTKYFTFNLDLKSNDPDAIYYGEIITLYNPNISRESIEVIPEHEEEKPTPTSSELDHLRDLLKYDQTLEANRFQIKHIKPQ